MNKHVQSWSMVISVITILLAPLVAAAASNPLYPAGVGFNPAVDYTLPNFSQSPNIRKFVDKVPGLGATGCTKSVPAGTGSCNENDLGQYIPLAVPDTTSFPGSATSPASDYYEIGEAQYTLQMHSDLPATTKIRGYYQKNGTDSSKQYLGVAILAKRYDPTKPAGQNGNGKPVRLKVFNELGKGALGNLPLPVDTTIMGAGMGPTTNRNFNQNRTTVHLHGGLNPWISDGTPHQWFTPANDTVATTAVYQKGASFQNVPDMLSGTGCAPNATKCFSATSSDGIGTYFYSNEQSARLLFYHDHAWGTTRLNVYAGFAAPYLIYDQFEEDMIAGTNVAGANPTFAKLLPDQSNVKQGTTTVAGGGAYRYGIPLVIQDKSFVNDATVPSAAAKAVFPDPATGYVHTPSTQSTDPLWYTYVNAQITPSTTTGGDLWFPHEYMPVENPFDPSGNTPNGRWDYAPFMIPPGAPLNLTLPSPTITPESFQDTMTVNGTAFPYIELPPEAVRFRILSVGNERVLNLQLYKADPLRINVTGSGSGYSASSPPSVTIGTQTGGIGSCGSATASVNGTGQVTAITVSGCSGFRANLPAPTVTIAAPTSGTTATAAAFVATEVRMVDAAPNANYPTWPIDGRDGGVPDPTTAGPPWIQIGNESGFLAKVAVVPAQPTDFEYNRQNIPLAGVTGHSLLLLPAMRADVIVDFTGYNDGDTLILYNDAPAPMPNFWPINDYYTDDPDQTPTGGAVTTPAGFGPNTRTVMQIRIAGTKASTLNYHSDAVPGFTRGAPTVTTLPAVETPATDGATLTALKAALPQVFAVEQNPILVPQLAYNDAYPSGPHHYAAATDNYALSYSTTFNMTGKAQPLTRILTTAPGANYAVAPSVVIVGGGGSGATATAGLNPCGAITLLTAGTGYTSAPTVTLGAPAAGGVQATATATVSGGLVTAINVVEPGSNYTNTVTAPTCTITGGGGTGATCSVMLPTLNTVGSITITNPGSGYTSQPLIFLIPAAGSNGTGAAAVARLNGDVAMTGKSITEGFDVEYGRMDIRMGSVPNPLTPTVGAGFVVGLARYIDPPTEILRDGEPIMWRLSHLGVDSHSLHFHLFDVQVVNRVDWTNVVKPPYPDEIGWRETIRTNPMEDIIVAMKPASMTLPFTMPVSNRLLDPSTPVNSTTNFYPVVPPAGVAAVAQQSNVMTNFGWEYVYHCHMLGHEENDFMRPMVLQVPTAAPPAPVLAAPTTSVNKITLTWTDSSTAANASSSFLVQRSPNTNTYATLATVPYGSVLSYDDTTPLPSTAYIYRIVATNRVGNSPASNTRSLTTPAWPATPTLISPTSVVPTNTPTFSWNRATNATSYTLQIAVTGGTTSNYTYTATQAGCTTAGTTCKATLTTAQALSPGAVFTWQVNAINNTGTSPWSTPFNCIYDATLTPVAPTLVNGVATVTTATPAYTWTAIPNASSYTLYTNYLGTAASTGYTPAQVGCSSGIGNCTITPATPVLAGNTSVSWSVNAVNSLATNTGLGGHNGTTGPWSAGGNFTYVTGTAPVTPTPVSPSGILTTAQIATDGGQKYTWNAVAGATSYTLYTMNFGTNPATAVSTVYTAANAHCPAGTGTCWVTQTPALTAGASIGWVINAINAAGFSPWSAATYFAVQ